MKEIKGILIDCDEQLILSFLELNKKYNFVIATIDSTHIFVKQHFEEDGITIETVKYLDRQSQTIINENSQSHDAYE